MKRIKFELPASEAVFEYQQKIPLSYINYGGHLGNDNILSLCHDARLAYLKSNGLSELEFFEHSLIMDGAMVTFKTEAFFDEELVNKIRVGETSRIGFELYHQIIRISDQKEVAAAMTTLLYFNYEQRKVGKETERIKQFFKETI